MVLVAPSPYSFYRVREYDDVEKAKEWCEECAAVPSQQNYSRLVVCDEIKWEDFAAGKRFFDVRRNKPHKYMVLCQLLEGLYQMYEWRSTWTFKKYDDGGLSASWKVHWSIVKSMFTHAFSLGWVSTNEAAKLKGFKTKSQQVQPFTPDQITAILAAVDKCGWDKAKAQRIRMVALLMRWSGMAIRDSVYLRRSALDKQNRIHTERTKTRQAVFVPLPPGVADGLRALPVIHPEYFFWDGVTPSIKVLGEYGRWLIKAFKVAGIASGHSHQLRHTFAVQMLVAGTPLETVSRLLGHKSVAVTEKHYSAWVPERQAKLELAVKAAWQGMELPE
jgi:integrase